MLDAILIFLGICSLLGASVGLIICGAIKDAPPVAVIGVIAFFCLLTVFLIEYDFIFTIVSKV